MNNLENVLVYNLNVGLKELPTPLFITGHIVFMNKLDCGKPFGIKVLLENITLVGRAKDKNKKLNT